MKSQFFLIVTAVVISLLFVLGMHTPKNNNILERLSKNFENEVYYILDNFNISYVADFTDKFKYFSEMIGYNFTYICWTNANLSLPSCTYSYQNCCYYFNKNEIINISLKNYSIFLLPIKEWICFYYKIQNVKTNEYIENFFCS